MKFTDEQIEAAIDQACGKMIKERKWAHTLNLLPEWAKAKEGEISTDDMSKVMTARLRVLAKEFDEDDAYEIENIIDEFDMAGDDVEQFDYAMNLLYDWADDNDVWVKTF